MSRDSRGAVVIDYRVWPDGTVQAVEDGEPYNWMSDDFTVVKASNEVEAEAKALGKVVIA